MNTSAVPSAPTRWLDIKAGIVILDLLLLCAMLAWLPFDPMVNKGLGILIFIAILWLTEAVNITITALSIPVLATLLGVFDMSKSLTDFANPVLFLFFGGFALAAALSKQGLDTQIAAKVMQLAKGHLGWAAIVLFTITAALSMWISNTATAAMMMPLALGMFTRSVALWSSSCLASPTAPASAGSALWWAAPPMPSPPPRWDWASPTG